jgi:hypothetical protein
MQLPECDFCERTDSIRKIGNSLACPDHITDAQSVENPHPSVNESPININEVLKKSREVDTAVQTRADLFNAETVSISDIFKAIDTDESITNKPFAKATELQTRINKQKQVIFELNQRIVDEHSRQRAQTQALNVLANQLRQEERDKLKLQDINYKPRDIRMPVTPKTIKMAKKRIDKAELRNAAKELGIPEFTLQMIIVQKNLSVKEAFEMFKKNIAEAKAKAAQTNAE